jgi:glucose uptake protein GlcU
MNVEAIITGLIAILLSIVGFTIESNRSAKRNKEEGWSYTRTKVVVSSWALLCVGVALIFIGIFDSN